MAKQISTEEIYKREIENVKANRFFTEEEKARKIKELKQHIKNKN